MIKHHPDVLILLLKRFEFNYSYMSYFKTSCFVEVPYSLQIPGVFTKCTLIFDQKSSSFFFLTLLFFVLWDQNEVYELYAVVDHFGGLRGGHYSATIKTQDEDRWYKFDDTQVTPVRLIAFSSV